ncbi:chromate transporter [Halomonas sp. E19]|uniref:chromate transporter n=1 Tax=Halomonas sp. E19 TaxID=3397247 RepID=UPI004034C45A
MLGAELPDHARPNRAWSLKISAICLTLWLTPVALLLLTLGPDNVFRQIATFFSQMAVVTFGGAYAVLSYVAQAAVQSYGWLAPGEMLDGLGMAETTPGPLIQVVQFVGFMGAFRDAAPSTPGWPPPWRRCSSPGSPSCPASCGSFSAHPTWSACATTPR